MTDVDGTCEYELDPEDPETWGGEENDECHIENEVLNEDGVWTCPHEAESGEDLCIFHLPVSEKDDADAVDMFLEIVDVVVTSDDPVSREMQFLGAKFGDFDLTKNPLDVKIEHGSLALDYSKIVGALDWSDSNIDVPAIYLNGIKIVKDASFNRTQFGGDALFNGAEFREDTYFNQTEFGGSTGFYDVEFGGYTHFFDAKFRGASNTFWGTKFEEDTHFSNAKFEGDISFSGVVFEKEANFNYATLRGSNHFNSTAFVRDTHTYFLNGTKFEGEAYFNGAVFGGSTNFAEANFEGETYFSSAEFKNGAFFESLKLDEIQFDRADLTESTFNETSLCNANFELALLSRVTMFGADLRGAKLSGAVLGDVRIDDDTTFLGHPAREVDASPHTISAIRSRPCCVYDPRYGGARESILTRVQNKISPVNSSEASKEDTNDEEDIDKAKSVYRALEELAGKAARPRLQARCFVRRQELQKHGYKRVMCGRIGTSEREDDDDNDGPSLEERVVAGVRWNRAKVAEMVLLYGESPWRIMGWSLGIITFFALLYPYYGLIESDDLGMLTWNKVLENPHMIIDSFYFSTITYTALELGEFTPSNAGGQIATIFESGFGVVLLALLVFVLGRRAAR